MGASPAGEEACGAAACMWGLGNVRGSGGVGLDFGDECGRVGIQVYTGYGCSMCDATLGAVG